MKECAASENLQGKIDQVREAQKIFATYSQKQVDAIFRAAAMAGNSQRIALAKMAIEETGVGILEDKILKNHYASEFVYNQYRYMKTCDVVETDQALGIRKVAESMGVIGALIPVTNPTSTAIFKILLCLKTRNALIISPHPHARRCTCEAARVLAQAAYAAGAPEGLIACLEEPSVALAGKLMEAVDMILATGGPGMLKAAYASGKPVIGAGAGNCPTIVDETANLRDAVCGIIHSKTFDAGMLCTSEQSMIVVGEETYQKVKREFGKWNAHVLLPDELEKLRPIMRQENGTPATEIIGRRAGDIARMAGIQVPEETALLVAEVTAADGSEPFAREKLSPLLALYQAATFHDALELADQLIQNGGLGHTAGLWIDPQQEEHIQQWYAKRKTCRLVLNSPTALGGIGDIYNAGLAPSLALECGSWGGGVISGNLGPQHLLNIKTVAEHRENMQWLRLPQKVYFQKGCTAAALRELREEYECQRVFLITDPFLYQNGSAAGILSQLERLGIQYAAFYDMGETLTLQAIQKGLIELEKIQPDAIIGLGGGSVLDAAKLIRYAYEHPEVSLEERTMPVLDPRKGILRTPRTQKEIALFAIPTTAGTGAESTPVAAFTDQSTGLRKQIVDYALLPTVAVVDVNHMMDTPKGLTRISGISVLSQAMEAYVSLRASDYTDGFALIACRNVFRYLHRASEQLGQDGEARSKLANAAALAGLACGNAFSGLNRAMANQLSAWHHLPNGISCGLLLPAVMEYNAKETPERMGLFSQYRYPRARARYAELAVFCGFDGGNVDASYRNLYQQVVMLRDALEIYPTIRAYGVEEGNFLRTLDGMCEAAWNEQEISCNPVYPRIAELRALYLSCYYGEKK